MRGILGRFPGETRDFSFLQIF